MKGFVQGTDRQQTTLLPECLDDWVDQRNPVRAVEVFVEAMELRDLGFDGVDPGIPWFRNGHYMAGWGKIGVESCLRTQRSEVRIFSGAPLHKCPAGTHG